jgi:hypothetical protein
MSNVTTKLAKDMGDTGDQICPHVIYIYHVPGVKVGSTYNLEDRLKAQGYDLSEVEVLYRIIAHTSSFNHIWKMEQVAARQLGLREEHNGNRIAVNRARAAKTMRNMRSYVVSHVYAPCSFLVDEPGEFERLHDLPHGSLSRAANPNVNNRLLTLNGEKYRVRYAD